MGKGTWTDEVAQMVGKVDTDGNPTLSKILMMMGPYGRLMTPLSYPQHVILVAGGIGVTPMMSTLQYIGQKLNSGDLQNLKSVKLVWTIPCTGSWRTTCNSPWI